MWLSIDIRNSVELPCGKICDDFDEREESLLGSRKAGQRTGDQRARGKFKLLSMKCVKLNTVIVIIIEYSSNG